jgi:hypothetical protein
MSKHNLNRFVTPFAVMFLMIGTLIQTNKSYAEDNGLVTVQSKMSYDQTVDQLKRRICVKSVILQELITQV